ncbi:MAG: phosphatase PAP2 family protein [Mycobacterium sp.]|nr:phosphatase PAP2 family protein [Mycobacterium sp.]
MFSQQRQCRARRPAPREATKAARPPKTQHRVCNAGKRDPPPPHRRRVQLVPVRTCGGGYGRGAGRVVLNVHYPSDVLAGWALGYLWFFVCLVTVRPRPLTAPEPDLMLTV